MRAFFANLMFTMIISVLWSLCFEMPFMTIDRILLSGRKQNLSKGLKTNNSAASGKDICQPKESSTTRVNDNPREHGCDVAIHDFTKTAKENDAEYINDTAETSNGKIYCINPIKCDKTFSVINFDNKRSDHVTIDFCHTFDGHSNEKELIDNAHRAKPNQSLKDSN